MKTKTLFKVALMLILLAGGVDQAWADGTISIPQASAGIYIPIGTVPTSGSNTTATGITLTGCSVDGNAKEEEYTSYTVGSTNGSPMTIRFDLTATAGNYLFSFKSGHAQGTSVISLSLKNSSNEEVWNNNGNNVNISNTGAWTLTEVHTFLLGALEAGNYTMTITGVSKSSETSYHGNFGNFCFHTTTTLAMPDSESNLLNVNMGTASGASLGGNYLTGITVNSYVDNVYMYIPQDGYYTVYAGYGYATTGTDNFTITITDAATGTAEVNGKNYTVTDSKKYIMTDKITSGWKKLRLDHPGPTITDKFRLEKMYFTKVNDWPLMGETTTYLDFGTGSLATTGSPRYGQDSKNQISYIKNGGYADNYYVEIGGTEKAYYDMCFNVNSYSNGGTLKVTITDLATGAVEVNAQESSSITATGQKKMQLTNSISFGLKKIRLDFTNTSTDGYLYNIMELTFYKRSLNENYDYSPVAATGVDVVLTRTLKANKWNTIVLPFNMTADQITSTFGAGTLIAQMTGISGGTVTFSKVTTMNAHEPYLIFVPTDFSSATISGVEVTEGTPEKTSVSGIDLIGSYDALTEIPYSNNSDSYYFISNNELYRSSTSGSHDTMKGTRAYFKVPGTSAARLAFVIEDDEINSVQQVETVSQRQPCIFYDLQGRRVKTFKKGLYIKRSPQGNLPGRSIKKIIM